MTYDLPDLDPLFKDENPDLRQDIRDSVGEWWLTAPNIHFGGKTPEEMIADGRGAWVRDRLRQIKYVGIT